jgi:glucose dehydrogenase
MIDICVIGSGVAGALVASEAAREGRSVVILETGKFYDDKDPSRYELVRLRLEPWPWHDEARDTVEPHSDLARRINHSRIKAVGGTTLSWNAYAPRLQPADFEMRSRFGIARDWPLSYDDIEPYLLKAEAEMGVAGGNAPGAPRRSAPYPAKQHPYSFADQEFFFPAFEAAGFRLGPSPMAIQSPCPGFATCSPMCPVGAKYTALVHLRRAEATGNVEVLPESHVRRLRLASSRSVGTVEYMDSDGHARALEARAFVLAAGGVETPRLLLLSAAEGPHANGLGNGSGMVGQTLMLHTNSGVRATLRERVGGHRIGFGTTVSWDLYDHSSFPEAGNLTLFPADLQGPVPADIAPSAGLFGDALKDHVALSYGSNVKIIAMGEMLPRRENRVYLSQSRKDRYGDPVPAIDLSMSDFEEASIKRGHEIGTRIMKLMDPIEMWTDRGTFLSHLMGTTCMGSDPMSSVCDEFGRCHELDNLYIAGSSLFSTAGSAHPQTVMSALAIRTAEHIVETL